GKHVILHGLLIFTHSRHNLIALRLVDSRIIRALPNQQGCLDLVRLKQRRLRLQKLLILTHATVKDRQKRRPVRRNRLQQRVQVGWTNDVHAAGKRIRRESHRSEEHTSELQSRGHLVCRLLLEKKNNKKHKT